MKKNWIILGAFSLLLGISAQETAGETEFKDLKAIQESWRTSGKYEFKDGKFLLSGGSVSFQKALPASFTFTETLVIPSTDLKNPRFGVDVGHTAFLEFGKDDGFCIRYQRRKDGKTAVVSAKVPDFQPGSPVILSFTCVLKKEFTVLPSVSLNGKEIANNIEVKKGTPGILVIYSVNLPFELLKASVSPAK